MASFTLGTAAAATGTAKSTILRAIRAGRISASRDDLGQWSIDPMELSRCFPLLAIDGAPPPQPTLDHDATTDMLVAELRATIADLRGDRDHWREAHERGQQALAEALAQTQRLIAPPVEQQATVVTPEIEQQATVVEQQAPLEATGIEQDAPPKQTWWRWFRTPAA